MMTCVNPDCRAQLEPDSQFCVTCGTAQRPEPATALVDAHRVRHGDATPQNETYVGQRLLFSREGIEAFDHDKLASGSFIRRLVRAYIVAVLAAIAVIIPLAIGNFVFDFGLYRAFAALVVVGLWFTVFFFMFNRPAQFPLSEWRFIAEGSADAADQAFDHVKAEFIARGTPTTKMEEFHTNGRRYLEVQKRPFVAYISCFAYGRDLYIGWTMWVSIRPTDGFGKRRLPSLADLISGRSDNLLQMTFRADEGKALREVIHSATRAAIDVAAESARMPVPVTAGNGASQVPVTKADIEL